MKKILVLLCMFIGTVAVGQGLLPGTVTRNGIPNWLEYPELADDGKALSYSASLRKAIWSTLSAGMIANGTEGQILRSGASAPAWASAIAVGIIATTETATDNLTAAQVNGGIISNYGQGAATTLTLPTAAAGYNFIVVVSATGNALHIKAGASDKLYLDGVALDDGDKASLATPALGNTLTCFTFQTGASAYDWICTGGGGASWTDGGA